MRSGPRPGESARRCRTAAIAKNSPSGSSPPIRASRRWPARRKRRRSTSPPSNWSAEKNKRGQTTLDKSGLTPLIFSERLREALGEFAEIVGEEAVDAPREELLGAGDVVHGVDHHAKA